MNESQEKKIHILQALENLRFSEVIMLAGRERRLLFGIPFAIAILTAVVSLFMTPVYTAKTVVGPLQPTQGSVISLPFDALGATGGAMTATGAAAGLKNNMDVYLALLKSDSAKRYLIEKFDLMNKFGTHTFDETVEALNRVRYISPDKLSGLITVTATDPNPQFAADLANGHVEALRKVLGRIATGEASVRRAFFENEVKRVSEKPFRDVTVQQMILASMMRQSETARIDEERNNPSVQHVDIAVPPDERSAPRRFKMTLTAALIGLFLGFTFIVARQAIRQSIGTPGSRDKWRRVKQAWTDKPKPVLLAKPPAS